MKEIIINEGKNREKTIAVLENEKLIEKYQEDESTEILDGNIYCGIVRNILPGMQSAFIDIGKGKNAFIHIKDIIPKKSNETGNKEEKFENYDIKKYIKIGDSILVQVKKDEENQKGAHVSKHISLTGKYVVLMPDVNFVTVSKKIENEAEKEQLKKLGKEILKNINNEPEIYGIIMRTSSINASVEEIKADIGSLVDVWKKILIKYDKSKINNKPTEICSAQDTDIKVIIDFSQFDECEVWVNTDELAERINKVAKSLPKKSIKVFIEKENLMKKFDIDEQLEKSKERKIWLKCGGFITIDKTEALTAIDVNSGKFIGKKSNTKEETLKKVNIEATIEIAKQIRIRNISGIIIVDYIDMENNEDREDILKLLNNELKKDRSKTQIQGFTKLDLLEMTRKKL